MKEGSWIGEVSSKRGMFNSVADLSVLSFACDWHYVVMGASPIFYLGRSDHFPYLHHPTCPSRVGVFFFFLSSDRCEIDDRTSR